MVTDHSYPTHLFWQGSTGVGYRSYGRMHRAVAPPAATQVMLSADPAFRGDPALLNPEQLLVMAVSSCQLLSFLALAARRQIDVVEYEDNAVRLTPGRMKPMRITQMQLAPTVRVAAGTDHARVQALMTEAHDDCYIANSLTSDVLIEAAVVDS